MKALPLPLVIVALSAGLVGSQATARTSIDVTSSAATTCYHSASARSRSPAAIAQCSAALQTESMSPTDRVATLVNRGIVLMLANRSSEAIRDFDAALALDSLQPEAYLNKGLTQYRIGNSAAAQMLANRALELRTQKPALAYYVRGLASEDRGDVRAAYADLRRAHQIEPAWDEPAIELQRYRVTR